MTGDNKASRAPSAFRQRDVTRAVKAVIAAGLHVAGVKVSAQGDIEVLTNDAKVQDPTPLDSWMAHHDPRQT
jgi:hypothetical protein